MNHSITVQNYGIRLRPVTMDDAEFIFELRRDPKLAKYIGEFDEQFSVHVAWLKRYFEREGDYYFCIETVRSNTPIGTIAIYDRNRDIAEWGRIIMNSTFPAAPGSVWLMYHVAFDILGLSSVYSRTVINNKQVVSFHDNSGAERSGIEPEGITIQGKPMDMIIHTVTADRWPYIKKRLEPSARMAERLLEEVT
ncbi:Protein N-acetyltransferase, RimJ/RimL family [Paenibacillus sp. yr247]|uniref:GNAT family N-acetyltransferase n=1 Tax=Paenibacillus sp. yr247 TaxID=1761880 RepID=UPI000880AE20|nr:GNAT family protein [Paenibacillus sp. yr247]SDO85197.1 Protein N-acetyltransferase, RimJ/RimL family [Paenibacillus sp. yr247]